MPSEYEYQWQCSFTSTTDERFHANKKYPTPAPKQIAMNNQALNVIAMSIRK